MMNYILKGHTPVPEPDYHKWGRWFDRAKRHVADTNVEGIRVSTVFLGIDYNWSGSGPPVLFETMIFGQEDEDTRRYATWEEAEIGHANAVAELLERGWPQKEST